MSIKLIADTFLSIRISSEEKEQLQQIAARNGITVSQLIRNIVQAEGGVKNA